MMMMSEPRKEKTMLKWLKQGKPSLSTHRENGAVPIEKITDDPLATIQVHPLASKKNKNKANEIYAVSRVNPLFEEEDVGVGKEVFSPGGHSGSSGYDSGSGPSDDDFPIIHNVAADLKDLQQNLLGRLAPGQSPTSSIVAAATVKPPQLFINTENDVIHHETAIVGPNGRPILQILEQNPQYVKSIALSVGNQQRKRPLSPISESSTTTNQQLGLAPPPASALSPAPPPQSKYNLSTSGSLYNKDAKKYYSNHNYTTIDSIGSARLVKKDSQYVRSIRIGGPTHFTTANANSNTATKRSLLEGNRRFSSGSSSSSSSNIPLPTRRPSVTFADDVGPSAGSSRSGSRKPSMEQDSIVTESLLMMTSVGDHPLTRRFSNASSSTSNSRKTSVSSSQSKSQDESSNNSSARITASNSETEIPSASETVDLEAFANSLRKSRPIKQLSSSSARSHGSSSADELEEGEDHLGVLGEESGSKGISTLDRPNSASSPPMSPTPRLHANKKSHKSPFGGIADHYAAAKEIAKEIESYSNGSAKASTKKSLVRDLLYRGNRNLTTTSTSPPNNNDNAIKITSANIAQNPDYAVYSSTKNGFRSGSREGATSSRSGDSRQQIHSPQPHHSQLLLAPAKGLISPPIYYDSPAYGSTTASARTGGNRRGGSTSTSKPTSPVNAYSPSPNGGGAWEPAQATGVVGGAPSGGSNDWELVRVQQVYLKASPQDHLHQLQQQQNHQLQKKNGKEEGEIYWTSKHSDSRAGTSSAVVGPQGQDYMTTGATTNSRRHHHISKPTASTSASASTSLQTSRGKPLKKVPSSGDDGLATGARSRIHKDGETDSGNSSDRIYSEVRLEIEGTRIELSGVGGGVNVNNQICGEARIQVEDDSGSSSSCGQPRPENLPSKVMIVTGDSQNIVVDLSGVPMDLKNAIVSGTALITLPDGLDKMLQPGYTMITIPASNTNNTTMSPSKSTSKFGGDNTLQQQQQQASGGIVVGGKDKKGTTKKGLDDDKPLVKNAGGNSSSDDECKLFATKNKAQIWDVIQQTVGGKDGGVGSGGKPGKKKITTIFPFHPNQNTYESPDFTIEGHRLDRQRKKVEHEKRRRCACRLCGMLFFLLAFLGVLVALSMIYTRGQRYFGSSV